MSFSSQIESPAAAEGDSGVGEIILFGVRVVVDSMRKSVSLNNLSQYEQPHHDAAAATANAGGEAPPPAPQAPAPGYASENDAVHHSGGSRERERKRGIPWTEEEHKLFLMGLQKVGKGDWRGISRNFVKTRTPTQVASHAQKYFLRRSNLNRRRRRSSLFDITTDSVSAIPMEEEQANNYHQLHQDKASHSQNVQSEPSNVSCGFSLVSACPMTVDNPMESLTLGHKSPENIIASSSNLVRPIPLHSVVPHGTGMTNLNLNLKSTFDASPLSLKLSLPTDLRESSPSSSSSSSSVRHQAFQSMPSFNNGDKIIYVA